jgi:hypothetical protein
MSFIEDFFFQIWISQNYEAFPKPYHLFCMLLETSVLGISLCQLLFYLLHSLIDELGSDNPIIEIRLGH